MRRRHDAHGETGRCADDCARDRRLARVRRAFVVMRITAERVHLVQPRRRKVKGLHVAAPESGALERVKRAVGGVLRVETACDNSGHMSLFCFDMKQVQNAYRIAGLLAAFLFAASAMAASAPYTPVPGQKGKDVVWIPSPNEMVEKM